MIFLCQNNKWAEYTSLAGGGTTVANVADRAAAYSMVGGVTVNGNDPVELFRAAGDAIERARGGGGPTLLEAVTYRFCGHYFGDQSEYIPAEELAAANEADPIPRFRAQLVDEFSVPAAELDEIDRLAQEEVDDAADWAFEQPLPDPSELTTDVYAEETAR